MPLHAGTLSSSPAVGSDAAATPPPPPGAAHLMCSGSFASIMEQAPASSRQQQQAKSLHRLHCSVQQYAWGRNSEDSEVWRVGLERAARRLG